MLRGVRTCHAILVTLGVLLGGCTDHGVAKLTKIKDQVCACKTVSCAEQAMQYADKIGTESNHRTQAIARAMVDCMAKLQAADRPNTDPDAEAPAVPAAPTEATGSAPAGK